ncbi:MAG TPA: Hsp20/alpha crystallin family protein [Nitrospira sp.]|nr:Hsp20/alpha crystallin family protein [Nitrospira sp.]
MRRGTPSLFSLTPRDFFSASPFELMRRFTEDMDRWFEGTGQGWGPSAMSLWSPPVEIAEKDGQFTVCAELPGLRKEDVKVELTQDGLTIRGERKREQEEEKGGIYRSERSYGSFFRTIPVPDDADMDQAKATFENGLLTVTVPLPETTKRRREIPIEGSSADIGGQTTDHRRQAQSGSNSGQAKAA